VINFFQKAFAAVAGDALIVDAQEDAGGVDDHLVGGVFVAVGIHGFAGDVPAGKIGAGGGVGHPDAVGGRDGEHLGDDLVVGAVFLEAVAEPGVEMFGGGLADAVGAVAEEIAVPVAPVIDPGLAVDQLIDQLGALIGSTALNEAC
jgi:hypothetical protein